MANERIISERVVSQRVIGNANPIARKFRNLKGSIGGLCIAPVLLILAFGLLFYSEKFERKSKIVESLSLEQATEAVDASGMHKVTGKANVTTPAKAPEVGNALYFNATYQEYKEVEKTEEETVTEIENGQEVEKTIERTKLVDEWTDTQSENGWAEFNVGGITIKPSGAQLEWNLTTEEYRYSTISNTYEELKAGTSITPVIGDKRLLVRYMPTDIDLLIVGEISQRSISGGDVFILSNKSDSQLISDMKTSETTMYWVLKFIVWLLLTIGIMSILGPILSVLDFIPIAGKAASCAASIFAAIISIGIVIAGSLIIKFWWLCLGLAAVGVVGLISLFLVIVLKKGGKKDMSDQEEKK
jgi:hypothetical protein